MKRHEDDLFEMFLYNNIIPLITSAVIIAVSWASLGSKIDLLNQKVEFLANEVQEYNQRNKDLQIRVGDNQLQIARIFERLGVKSLDSATLK